MKVFISWSKAQSHQVALAFKEWLPSIIQTIDPYVSSEDTDKGSRWNSEIAKELEQSSYGILCVTKDNMAEPWLLFEAGALSNKITQAFVCPFLFDLKPSQVKGPLEQFQSTIFEKEDVRKLISAINKASGDASLKEDLLNKTFDKWWPDFEAKLNALKAQQPSTLEAVDKAQPDDVLEKILEIVRINQRLLNTPEQLIPPRYLSTIITEIISNVRPERFQRLVPMIDQAHVRIEDLRRRFEVISEKGVQGVESSEIMLFNNLLSELASRIEELRFIIFRSIESI